jgi:hypothetical protein
MDFLIQKAYAATTGITGNGGGSTSFNTLLNNINNQIVSPLIYLMFALAIFYFLWGVLVFIRNADSAEKRSEGFDHMMWGIIGIFIMVSAKGLINIILATLGL